MSERTTTDRALLSVSDTSTAQPIGPFRRVPSSSSAKGGTIATSALSPGVRVVIVREIGFGQVSIPYDVKRALATRANLLANNSDSTAGAPTATDNGTLALP